MIRTDTTRFAPITIREDAGLEALTILSEALDVFTRDLEQLGVEGTMPFNVRSPVEALDRCRAEQIRGYDLCSCGSSSEPLRAIERDPSIRAEMEELLGGQIVGAGHRRLQVVPSMDPEDALASYVEDRSGARLGGARSMEDLILAFLLRVMESLDDELEGQMKRVESLQSSKPGETAAGDAGERDVPSVDVEMMKADRLLDKREQMFKLCNNMLDKRAESTREVLQSMA